MLVFEDECHQRRVPPHEGTRGVPRHCVRLPPIRSHIYYARSYLEVVSGLAQVVVMYSMSGPKQCADPLLVAYHSAYVYDISMYYTVLYT